MSTALRSALLMALLATALPSAHAEGTLGFHIGSQHIPERKYNNYNPGIYYRNEEGWTIGGYYNSLRRPSVYAGYTWKLGPVDVTTAPVTGYSRKITPLVVPSITVYRYEGVRVRMAYIPRVEKKIGSHVIHLMAEY